MYNSWDN